MVEARRAVGQGPELAAIRYGGLEAGRGYTMTGGAMDRGLAQSRGRRGQLAGGQRGAGRGTGGVVGEVWVVWGSEKDGRRRASKGAAGGRERRGRGRVGGLR